MKKAWVVSCVMVVLITPTFVLAQTTGCDASQTCGQQMLDKLEAIRNVLIGAVVVISICLGVIAGRLR